MIFPWTASLDIEESDYIKGLDESAGSKYHQKIKAHVGSDLYKMKKRDFSHNLIRLPAVDTIIVTNYVILQTS